MISVVISAKDAESTIRLAVTSALVGLSSEDEVLVLCDGCSDSTETVVRSIQDSRVRTFAVSESLGRSQGRNFLLDRAKSDFIAILDADDICLPWRFSSTKRLLRKYDAVFSTAVVFGRQLRPFRFLFQVPRQIKPIQMPIECLGRNPLVHSSAAFRRESLDLVGDYRNSEAEEYDLWLRMLNSGARLYRAPLPWVMYRIHKGQASQVAGFVARGLSCHYVIQEQRSLAVTLGISAQSIEGIRSAAQEQVRTSGFWARLEVLGLAGLRGLLAFRGK